MGPTMHAPDASRRQLKLADPPLFINGPQRTKTLIYDIMSSAGEKNSQEEESMPTDVMITIGDLSLPAELNDSPSAQTLESLLPLEFPMSRWGDEYYGDCGIEVEQSGDAKEIMEIGDLAVWPVGKAFCIFFGPTPASTGDEPRAASAVNPVGKLKGNTEPLKRLGGSVTVRIALSK